MNRMTLLERVKARAINEADGHFTIFASTTNYKAVLGTPSCDAYELTLIFSDVPGFDTVDAALEWLVPAPVEKCKASTLIALAEAK